MIDEEIINKIVQMIIDKYTSRHFEMKYKNNGEEYIFGKIEYKTNEKTFQFEYTEDTPQGHKNWCKIKYLIFDKNESKSISGVVHINPPIKSFHFLASAISALKESIRSRI